MLRNSGCTFLMFIVYLIGVFIFAINGDFFPLTFTLIYISIPLLIILIAHCVSPTQDNKTNKTENDSIIKENTSLLKKVKSRNFKLNNSFYVSDNYITGRIEDVKELKELLEFSKLTSLKLTCKHPTEISALINNNENLITVFLMGPFYFDYQIRNTKINTLVIHNNPNLNDIILKISKNNKLQKLSLISNPNFSIDDINPCLSDLIVLEIIAPLISLPKVFQYNLVSLSLNNCDIIDINESVLENSKLEILNLCDNSLNNIPLSIFSKLRKLRKINVEGNPIKLKNLKQLQDKFKYKTNFDKEYLELLIFKNNIIRFYILRLIIFSIISSLLFYLTDSYSLLFVIILFGLIFIFIYIDSDIKHYRSLNISIKYKNSKRIYLSKNF